jgi:hypothetical protein
VINWSSISLKDLAGYLSEELKKRGIDTVLVGGACVTIYSENRYQSFDLDYVTYEDMKKVKKALGELGFTEKSKYFWHEQCPWVVEFVSPPVAVGNEPIRQFAKVKTSLGTITCLNPIDSVRDRLASFYHWNDRQSLEQALNICLEHKIDLDEVRKWSLREGHGNKFQIFFERLKKIGYFPT